MSLGATIRYQYQSTSDPLTPGTDMRLVAPNYLEIMSGVEGIARQPEAGERSSTKVNRGVRGKQK